MACTRLIFVFSLLPPEDAFQVLVVFRMLSLLVCIYIASVLASSALVVSDFVIIARRCLPLHGLVHCYQQFKHERI